MIPEPNFFDTSDVPSLQPYFDKQFDDPMKDKSILQIYQAELDVLSYFLDEEPREAPVGTFSQFPVVSRRPQLSGFVGTIETPEIAEMDQPLIEAIKRAIVNVFQSRDEDPNIESLREGDRTVEFKTSAQKKNLKGLMIYDNRESFTYL